jgi:hypothetical protein
MERSDIVVGHVEAPSTIYFNDGSGRHYSPVQFGDAKGTVYGFAIADTTRIGAWILRWPGRTHPMWSTLRTAGHDKVTHRFQEHPPDPVLRPRSYNHVSTGNYAIYFVDHRVQGLRDYIGWDLTALGKLPFMVWVRRMEIDFLQPARGDQEITITSFVRRVPRARCADRVHHGR